MDTKIRYASSKVNVLKQIMVLTKNSFDAIFEKAKLRVQQLKSICKFSNFSWIELDI